MAGSGYLKCEICGDRIMYKPDVDPYIQVVCMECYNKNQTGENVPCLTSTIKRNTKNRRDSDENH